MMLPQLVAWKLYCMSNTVRRGSWQGLEWPLACHMEMHAGTQAEEDGNSSTDK